MSGVDADFDDVLPGDVASLGTVGLLELLGERWYRLAVAGAQPPLTATMLSDPAVRAHFAGHHPTKRVGESHEVAHAVAMLADDEAGHMQANVVTIDGGITRAIGYAVIEPPKEKQQ